MQNVCAECGARNEVDVEFCLFCHAFLAWDEEPDKSSSRTPSFPVDLPAPSESVFRAQAVSPGGAVTNATQTVARPTSAEPAPDPDSTTVVDTTAGLFNVEADQPSVELAATGEPALVTLRVANTSSIVDGYAVEATNAPAWLALDSEPVQLLPGTEEAVPLRLRVVSDMLVPAHKGRLTLRVESLSQAPAHSYLLVEFVVPPIDVPVRVHAEPRMLRARDRASAECDLVLDNSSSNQAVRLSFAGSDPELVVGFAFDPPEIGIAPGATESVRVTVTAPAPEPGQEVSRSLTLKAVDGGRSVDAYITLHQSTTREVEDPPVGLEVHPSLVRVEDGAPAMVRVVADNRGGAKWAHLKFRATDPEQVVDVMWIPSRVDVPPGKTAQVEARLEAPPPAAGAEVSRTVTVEASDDRRVSTAIVTLVQVTSASPLSTLELRAEPSIVRVHDAESAVVRIVVDNQHGRSAARVFLRGTDPEQALGFAFSASSVEVPPGQARPVALRLDARRPPPGQEAMRQFTITASDGQTDVEATGTLVQTSSRDAIELLSVRLDPSVLRLAPFRRGTLAARVDNRGGAYPVRVSMSGDDPENIIGFAFAPRVLDIPAGKVANSRVTVRIKRGPGASEMTRPITIVASDGHAEAQADGELIQAAVSYRPLARVLFTLLGGLAMILGAFGPWLAISGRTGLGLDVDTLARLFGVSVDLSGIERMVSAGLIAIVLGALTIFGLTGGTGRLTRLASAFGALLLVALFVAFAVVGLTISPGSGAILTFLGCIVGYVGGLLVRR